MEFSIKGKRKKSSQIGRKITKFRLVSSPLAFDDEHSILVWTLSFYLMELTSKVLPECNLLVNAISASISTLKQISNLTLFLCIIHVSFLANLSDLENSILALIETGTGKTCRDGHCSETIARKTGKMCTGFGEIGK